MDKPAFKMGDYVEKISGSSWRGRVVGTYSTDLTPEGYAVESDTEKGSVQIYPAKALRLATPANGEQVEWVKAAERAFVRFNRGDEKDGPPSPYERAAVAAILSALSTPTEDARERVKVLEEALAEAGRMSFAAASIPEGYIDGWTDCVEHIRNAEVRAALVEARHEADTALGNKETDRHG